MLNENIKKYRKEKGFSQETMAQELNVVRQTVSKWEKGISVPDAEMLTKISETLDIPVMTLLGGTAEDVEEKTDNSAIANQLYILNNQFAKELYRRRRNRNIVLSVLLAFFVMLPLVLFFVFYAKPAPSVNPVEYVVIDVPSDIFTSEEISSAIDCVAEYMDKNFNGCYLKSIRYAGDDLIKREMKNRGSTLKEGDIIILISDFYVEKHGGDGSLNTNYTYTDWSWILEKTASGQWTEIDHGYG